METLPDEMAYDLDSEIDSEEVTVTLSELLGREENPSNTNGMLGLGQWLWLFLSLSVVVVLAIYVTKFVARQRIRLTGKNINIIDSAAVGQNSSIVIVKIGTKYMLLGATKDSVSHLQNLDEGDLNLEYLENIQPVSFSKYLDKFLMKKESEKSEDN